MTGMTQEEEYSIPQNDNITTTIDINKDTKTNEHSQKVSYPSYVSYNNPLISESDLKDPTGFQYSPEIINNINKFENSDRWFCFNCSLRDDKWGMMKHICKLTQKKKEEQ